jgi:hypothetical protein
MKLLVIALMFVLVGSALVGCHAQAGKNGVDVQVDK